MAVHYHFTPLKDSDLEMLCNWLEKPHVLAWWNDHLTRDELKEKYRARIGDPVVCPYIIYFDHQPIGFIQYYWASKIGNGWWLNEGNTTVGLDQFIGEEGYLNQGHGSRMLQAFIRQLFNNPSIEKIITEADPKNFRAKRCYEKAGFKEVGEIDTPDGKSILMAIYRDNIDLI